MGDSSVAIVTGGASGLGAAICKALLKNGYKVCVSDIQEENGKRFVGDLQKVHGSEKVIFATCDVTKEEDYKKLFDSTIAAFGKVDVLCNNAGVILEQDPLQLLKINLMGPIIGGQTAIKYLGKSNGGKGGIVVNTASIAGFIPISSVPVYVASKFGVVGLTRSYGLPYHFDKEGIIFTALCPFYINTPLLETFKTNSVVPDLDVTTRPNLLDPDYVAKAVLKLLEDRINGSCLVVTHDGGYQYVGYQDEFKHIPLE